MAEQPVHITNILLENLGPYRRFESPAGAINVISGKNGGGKTKLQECVINMFEGGGDPSLIRKRNAIRCPNKKCKTLLFEDDEQFRVLQGDRLQCVLCGHKWTVTEFRSDGEIEFDRIPCESGEITVTLSNGYIAWKQLKEDGFELVVKNPEGGVMPAPASVLRQWWPKMSLSPKQFLKSDKRARAKFILEHYPVEFLAEAVNAIMGAGTVEDIQDLKSLDALRRGVEKERKEINADHRNLVGAIARQEAMLAPDSNTDWTAQANAQQTLVTEKEKQRDRAKLEIESEANTLIAAEDAATEKAISELRQASAQRKADIRAKEKQVLDQEIGKLSAEVTDLSAALATARAKAQAQQREIGIRENIAKDRAQLPQLADRSLEKTRILEALDSLKFQTIAFAIPIAGVNVRFDDDNRPEILLDGLDLDSETNTQKQLFFAAQLLSGVQGKGNGGMIWIDGEDLDANYLEDLKAASRNGNRQLWLTERKAGADVSVRVEG